jgi:hypothetical protein
MIPSANTANGIQYAGFDKVTGRIVQLHTRFSVAEGRYVEVPIDELKTRFSKHEPIVQQLSDRNPNNLDFIKVESGEIAGPMMVDVVRRKLVPQQALALSSDKSEIVGDGQDSANLDISVVDSGGNLMANTSGEVRVTTSRGKLSARGGIVSLVGGRATLTLTSANETVSRVRVTAASVDRSFVPANLDLEFL